MKNITKEQEEQIKKEVQTIIDTIYGRKIKCIINLKQGGHTASASFDKPEMWIRIDTWLRMPETYRKLVVCHEVLHWKGYLHGAKNFYSYSTDLAAIALYRKVYGTQELETLINNIVLPQFNIEKNEA